MWPTVVVGGFAVGWIRNVWLRGTGLLLAVALQVPVIQDAILDNPSMTTPERIVAIGWYMPMIALEAWGFSVCFTRRSDRAPDPGPVKRVIFAIPTVVMIAFSTLVLGVADM